MLPVAGFHILQSRVILCNAAEPLSMIRPRQFQILAGYGGVHHRAHITTTDPKFVAVSCCGGAPRTSSGSTARLSNTGSVVWHCSGWMDAMSDEQHAVSAARRIRAPDAQRIRAVGQMSR